MAAYNKVEVSLNTNAVEVGIPSPQTVNVTIPTVGPAGPTGPQGPKGDPGDVSGSIAWDNVTDKPASFTPSSHTHELADLDSSGIAAGKFLQADGDDGAQWADVTGSNVTIGTATASGFVNGNGVYYPTDVTLNSRNVFKLNKTYGMFFEASKWHIFENVPITANILYSSNTTSATYPWQIAWGDGNVDQSLLADAVSDVADQFVFVGDNIPSSRVTDLATVATSGDYDDLSNKPASLTPSAHASSHHTGGSDALTANDIGAAPLNHASRHGPGADDEILPSDIGAVSDDDARLSDARTPTSHAASHATGGSDAIAPSDIGAANTSHTHPASDITSGTLAHERGGLEADVSAYSGLLKIASGSTSAVTVTTAGEALLDDADAAAQRTTLELGTLATINNPMTSQGDLIVGGSSGTPARLGIGTASQQLRVNSGATGLEYFTPSALPIEFVIACSDETTDLTTGTAKVTFRAPVAFLLTGVAASVNTAPTGSTLIVDINNGANSALSTKLSIDASEKTSATAATAAVIDTSYDDFAADAEITIDIDQTGSTVAGKGLKVILKGTRA